MNVDKQVDATSPQRVTRLESRSLKSATLKAAAERCQFAAQVILPSDLLPFDPPADGRFATATTAWYLGFVRRAWAL